MTDPKGKPFNITTFVGADHVPDIETRQFITGLLGFLNKTPIHCYRRRQNTGETRIVTELTIKMRYKLRIVGVTIDGPSQILVYN